jgi:hypothetical protein
MKKKSFPNSSDFGKKHDPKIKDGELAVTLGWVAAAEECVAKFRGNASAYARASVNGFSVSQTEATIRQYVGVIVAGIKHYGSAKDMLTEYDAKYETREIVALRTFLSGLGQRKKDSKKVAKQDTVAITKRKATAFVTKFVPANKRDEALESLGF